MTYMPTEMVLEYINKMCEKYNHYPEPEDIELESIADGIEMTVDIDTYESASKMRYNDQKRATTLYLPPSAGRNLDLSRDGVVTGGRQKRAALPSMWPAVNG